VLGTTEVRVRVVEQTHLIRARVVVGDFFGRPLHQATPSAYAQ